MGRRKRPRGRCHLCSCIDDLSWEHVPPESAFNDRRVVRAKQQQMFIPGPWDGRDGAVEQRGNGAFTLCEPCNRKTGKWYGREYADWAKQGLELLQRIGPENDAPFSARYYGHPLRFIKQVITMFFSVNTDAFAELHPDLVKFVLNRDAKGIPPQYRLELVLVRGPFARSSGVYGSADVATGRMEVASEVAYFPFGLLLFFDQERCERPGAIEWMANCGFYDEREVWVRTYAGYVATKYPGDYRSRQKVDSHAAKNLVVGDSSP